MPHPLSTRNFGSSGCRTALWLPAVAPSGLVAAEAKDIDIPPRGQAGGCLFFRFLVHLSEVGPVRRSQSTLNPDDSTGASAAVVDINDDTVKPDIPLRCLKATRTTVEKASQALLHLHTDDALMGARHSQV